MQLTINGEVKVFSEQIGFVSALFDALNISQEGRIVELNGELIKSSEFASAPLKPHDNVEIIQFMGGGSKS